MLQVSSLSRSFADVSEATAAKLIAPPKAVKPGVAEVGKARDKSAESTRFKQKTAAAMNVAVAPQPAGVVDFESLDEVFCNLQGGF